MYYLISSKVFCTLFDKETSCQWWCKIYSYSTGCTCWPYSTPDRRSLVCIQISVVKRAILADEVGLGKTIEAGIILSQNWAEHKRRLIVICPANLRMQWCEELQSKFYLPTILLESKSFNAIVNEGNFNPFNQEKIVICSYQFAKSKAVYLRQTRMGKTSDVIWK